MKQTVTRSKSKQANTSLDDNLRQKFKMLRRLQKRQAYVNATDLRAYY